MSVTFIEPEDSYPLKYEDLEVGETYLDDTGDVIIPLDKEDNEVSFARGVGFPVLALGDGGRPTLYDFAAVGRSDLRFRKADLGIVVNKK